MNIHSIIPLVSCLAYIVLIGVTLVFGRKRVRGTFLLYLCAAMAWSFFSFMAHANYLPDQLVVFHELLIVFLIAVSITYYHFVSVFVDRINMIGIAIGYVVLLLFTIFTLSGRVLLETRVETDGVLIYDLGIAEYFIAVAGVTFMLMAIYLLVQHYRQSTDFQQRNRTAYLIAGGTLVLALALTNLWEELAQYPIDQFGNLTNAILITFVVIRYQLLDIKVAIRKGLSYSLVTVGLTTGFILALFALWTRYGSNWAVYSGVAVLALLFAIVFQFLRGYTQRWVDKLFYMGTYNYRRTLLTFSQRMRSVLNLNELAENMLVPIIKALHTKHAILLLPDTDSGDFAARFVQPEDVVEAVRTMRIRSDSPITNWLLTNGTTLQRESIDLLPEFKSLWLSEKEDIESLELELFCPLRRKGILVGILVLSRKMSDTSYSGEDIDLLTTMANEAAVVIENATMFDNLREQQQRVEQLLVGTVQAQEEERRRISVELHDGVAQWLVGASYQLQSCQAVLAKDNPDGVSSDISKLGLTIDKSLKEIRSVIAGLRPPALEELGLVHAIKQTIKDFSSDGISCRFETFGKQVRLSSSTELTIYRVIQESLNNIKKHSEATSVTVKLRFTGDRVSIEVNDNGKGFDYFKTIRQAATSGHMGLLGMRERALMMGGNLKINSKMGGGSRINLTLPITESGE